MKTLSEKLFSRHKIPLGMNLRNYLIREYNSFESLDLAKDKSGAKRLFSEHGIITPKTFFEIKSFSDLSKISLFPDEFVIKPSRGFGGNGIMVLQKNSQGFLDPSGEVFSENKIRKHIRKILDGEFSGHKEEDVAIVEERIFASPKITFKESAGLPDIRIFCVNYVPVMAMMRHSTKATRGRANLTVGAIGIGIDVETGRVTHLFSKKEEREFKLSDFDIPENFRVPHWKQLIEASIEASKLSQLSISGVDLIIDRNDRVVLIEINGRPGIEIQNVNKKSLLESMRLLS
ncbi:MAG: sugar-transfer associated ATP-grasp domain-containing protein [Parcubacteria group bacterium]|jgi:alpha-L-glutamate ligase-like protein